MLKQILTAILCISLVACGLNPSRFPVSQPTNVETIEEHRQSNFDRVTLNLDIIRQIVCINDEKKYTSGTMFMIAPSIYVSADHVTEDHTCFDYAADKPVLVYKKDAAKDISLIRGLPIATYKPLRVSCEGFQKGRTYYLLGFAHGTLYALNAVVATGNYTGKDFIVDGVVKEHLHELKGLVVPGQSGGPVVDLERGGVVVGLNNVTAERGTLAYSRELKDTFICKR